MTIHSLITSLQPEDAAWAANLRGQLEREANTLDLVTAARLSAARHRALAVAGDRAGSRWLSWLGAAVAASLLLAVLLVRGPPQAGVAERPVARSAPALAQPDAMPTAAVLMASDVAVIADLEFYDWLEGQDAVL